MVVDYELIEIMHASKEIANTLAKKGQQIGTYIENIRRNNPEKIDQITQLERLLNSVKQTHSESVAAYEYLNSRPSF